MRFRFCGDLDCPDWVLAEITTLSRLSSVKMKLLCNQVIKNLLGTPIDYEKVKKSTADAKFEVGDIKGSIAALAFILSSAARHGVHSDALSNELQQLGLPKEHSTSLCKSYSDSLTAVQDAFKKQSLRLSQVESVDWRVDYVLSSSQLKEVNEPCAQLRLRVRDVDSSTVHPVAFTVEATKLRVLLHELKQAYATMEGLGTNSS